VSSEHFRVAIGDDAGGAADEGRGKLALVPGDRVGNPLLRMACRDAHGPTIGEQELLRHILAVVESSGYSFSRALVVNYYISLKTNPFVVLTGAEGRGKTELVRLFAEALVGRDSPQYTLIPSAGAWPGSTGQDSYYRSLHEQFSSWRFLDLLQEASASGNIGKAYLVCFDALHPDELEYYFATLLQIGSDGSKRLNLPGFPADRLPVVPPNVYITVTVNTAGNEDNLSRNVLRNAAVIEFRAPARLPAPRFENVDVGLSGPPPVGYQRIWLGAALRGLAEAQARMVAALGPDFVARLHSSADLQRLTWRVGFALKKQNLDELTMYIANSFDAQGRGLFDPRDAEANARVAYDAQVVQRVLWRLRESDDAELRRDLAEYLDRQALSEAHQDAA
jgi:energy-coupling factor transporter ATP-binding protein EcfA2